MSQHVFRNPDKYKIEPFRAWLRLVFPNARDGFVVTDLDSNRGIDQLGKNAAIRRYGKNYKLDELGDLMLIEIKENNGKETGGERWVYGWIDSAIKTGDMKARWRGYQLLKIEYVEDFPICSECRQTVLTEEKALQLFLNAKLKWNYKDISHEELKHTLGDV